MGIHFYDESPSWPAEQLGRLKPPATLFKAGIPCVVYADDALSIIHRVPIWVSTLQLLVREGAVEAAAEALCSLLPYKRMREDEEKGWREFWLVDRECPHIFNLNTDTIFLEHRERRFLESLRFEEAVPMNIDIDAPMRIFIHASSVYHFDLDNPALTCLNPTPPSEESKPILFPTLPAFYDSLISTFYEPPKKHRNSMLTSALKTYISFLNLYTLSDKGVLYTDGAGRKGEGDVRIDPEDRVLIPPCFDVLKRMQDENRPHLIRSLLNVRSLDYEQGAIERLDIRSERLARLGLPAPPTQPIALLPIVLQRSMQRRRESGEEVEVAPRLTPFLNRRKSGLEWRALKRYASIAQRMVR